MNCNFLPLTALHFQCSLFRIIYFLHGKNPPTNVFKEGILNLQNMSSSISKTVEGSSVGETVDILDKAEGEGVVISDEVGAFVGELLTGALGDLVGLD